jgi:hypothetical protein
MRAFDVSAWSGNWVNLKIAATRPASKAKQSKAKQSKAKQMTIMVRIRIIINCKVKYVGIVR